MSSNTERSFRNSVCEARTDSGSRDVARRRNPKVEGILVEGPGAIRQQRSGIERRLAKELDTRRDDGHNGAGRESFHGANYEGAGV